MVRMTMYHHGATLSTDSGVASTICTGVHRWALGQAMALYYADISADKKEAIHGVHVLLCPMLSKCMAST